MRFLSLLFSMLTIIMATVIPTRAEDDYAPPVAEASAGANLAIQGFVVPEFLQAELAAAEPDVANPVAFCFDEQGRIYVAETFRQGKGVEDNRNHMYWLHDDLQAQSVADREAYIRKHHADDIEHYTKDRDRIRRLVDANKDGIYEYATVFEDGVFHSIVDGTGAGLLATGNTVYYTCIPHLWKLEDTDEDGHADLLDKLHSGYGVRFAFRGHDMHGLVWGPDGRIYYSIGDRGYNVTTKEGKQLVKPYTGAVFRCWPDGTGLEVFATGLRNPQELAFDDYGNLFTGDNNSDSGDQARWVYICEGMDAGWRMYYQYKDDRGPWNRERMWYPHKSDKQTEEIQPAYIVPPILNISDGPSGLVYYPGWGLPERYKNHFFLADFRGSANNSGIRSFAMKPKGAGFELVDSHQFIWSILATDVDFGYDGKVYISDWVNGWNGEGKGRIYSFGNEKNAQLANEVTSLMAADWSKVNSAELAKLLSHADRRVRLKSQFELTKRKETKLFLWAMGPRSPKLARIHAIWGLGQIARSESNIPHDLIIALSNRDPEIIAQALSVLGDLKKRDSVNHWTITAGKLLEHESPRIRYHAAIALGKQKATHAFNEIVKLLAENGDTDPYLRHAGIMGLVGCGSVEQLVGLKDHNSVDVRLAAVVALRKLESEKVTEFLADNDQRVVLEAARVHDESSDASLTSALSKLNVNESSESMLIHRVLNANYRLGQQEHAKRVIAIAATRKMPEDIKREALEELLTWDNPTPLDRVTNKWRPLPEKRETSFMAELLRPVIKSLITERPKLQVLGIELAGKYKMMDAAGGLTAFAGEPRMPEAVRVASMRALDEIDYKSINRLMFSRLDDPSEKMRSVAREILARRQPKEAVKILEKALADGSLAERQNAINVLADIKDDSAQSVLLQQMQNMLDGKADAGTHLDLLQVAKASKLDAFKEINKKYDALRKPEDELAQYRETLVGGDAARGKEIFFGRAAASCRRCHKVNNDGGGVGPDLSTIAKDKNREYLLESIVLPNKKIAKGFDTVLLILDSGKVATGLLKKEDDKTITLLKPLGEPVVINKDEVIERATGKSGMPEDLKDTLKKSEIRDLVEYLSTLKTKKDGDAHGKKETEE